MTIKKGAHHVWIVRHKKQTLSFAVHTSPGQISGEAVFRDSSSSIFDIPIWHNCILLSDEWLSLLTFPAAISSFSEKLFKGVTQQLRLIGPGFSPLPSLPHQLQSSAFRSTPCSNDCYRSNRSATVYSAPFRYFNSSRLI